MGQICVSRNTSAYGDTPLRARGDIEISGIIDVLLTDLRSLIRNLGKDGGLISPSVVELLLPWLLDEVASLGLELSREPYATLIALGKHRRWLTNYPEASPCGHNRCPLVGGMRKRPRLALIDGAGGVGHREQQQRRHG